MVFADTSSIKKARLNYDDENQKFALQVVSRSGKSRILIVTPEGITLYNDDTGKDVWHISAPTASSDPSMPNGELS